MTWKKQKKVHSLFCTCSQCVKKGKIRRHGKNCHCNHCSRRKDKKTVKKFYTLILGSVLLTAILF